MSLSRVIREAAIKAILTGTERIGEEILDRLPTCVGWSATAVPVR